MEWRRSRYAAGRRTKKAAAASPRLVTRPAYLPSYLVTRQPIAQPYAGGPRVVQSPTTFPSRCKIPEQYSALKSRVCKCAPGPTVQFSGPFFSICRQRALSVSAACKTIWHIGFIVWPRPTVWLLSLLHSLTSSVPSPPLSSLSSSSPLANVYGSVAAIKNDGQPAQEI